MKNTPSVETASGRIASDLETATMRTGVPRGSVYVFAAAVFLSVFGVCLAFVWSRLSIPLLVGVLAISFVAATSIRISEQWEKVVIVRFGKLSRVVGPGLYLKVPFVEHDALHVDQRINATSFQAEEALTADLAPIDVDAVLFWMVWDPKKAYTEVRDYQKAVLWSAQTALRDAIGQINLADVAARRKQIDVGLQEILEEKINPWGITIVSVEIRNIVIPAELQSAMSKEAQAERERNARLILADVEREISDIYVEAGEAYSGNSEAMSLRTMNLIYESIKEGGSLVIAPSSFGDGFNISAPGKE